MALVPPANTIPVNWDFLTAPGANVAPAVNMVITPSGNVGIGITPTARLDVQGTDNTDSFRVFSSSNTNHFFSMKPETARRPRNLLDTGPGAAGARWLSVVAR